MARWKKSQIGQEREHGRTQVATRIGWLNAPPAQPDASLAPNSPNPYHQFIAEANENVRTFYDALSEDQFDWHRRYRYYRQTLINLIRHFVPDGSRVLDVGSATGDLLAALHPREGVGLDCAPNMVEIARRGHPGLTFVPGFAERLDEADIPDGPYEYITLVNVIGEMADIGTALRKLHRYCSAETRIIIVHFNHLWEPVCRLAARLGLKTNNPTPNWLSAPDVADLLTVSDFEVIRKGYSTPMPVRIPGLAWLCNAVLGRLNGFRKLGFLSYVVARPIVPAESPDRRSVSVVVPCKNEQDNIDGLVERIPEMGAGTEIIFVDDQSTDATAAHIDAAIARRTDRNIKRVTGPGRGKGAACRAGFAQATGDVLMILDADMTVMPEELPAFFHALVTGRGEFINGSRMVYPQEQDAMRTSNIVGNKVFAGLFSLLLDQRIRDTLCGTKVIWRRDYGKLMASRAYFDSCDVWGDYDWLFGAAKNNLKIVELPVHYRERVAGVTKMTRRVRNGLTMLRMCGIAFRKLRWI
jgi:ubiquinone/menaquinone biosynthesis C-methylase UbiE